MWQRQAFRSYCSTIRIFLDSSFYLDAIRHRSPETIANIAITIIHQTDVFLRKLIERLQQDFLHNGGIKEQMYRARINYRDRHKS